MLLLRWVNHQPEKGKIEISTDWKSFYLLVIVATGALGELGRRSERGVIAAAATL